MFNKFLSQKNLRAIGLLVLLYSALIIITHIINIIMAYFNINKSPLIPEYLSIYIAFPSYFIISFFVFILYLMGKELNKKEISKYMVLICFVISFLHYFFWMDLELAIHEFNPYG